MKLRTLATVVLASSLALGACKKRQPAVPSPSAADSIARARADSIALAERAQAERERMERERAARERSGALDGPASRARAALTEVVFFEYDSDELSGEAERKLQIKAAVLQANPNVRVRIAGHADQRGSTEYNLALGIRRAEAVRAFLTGYGIEASRFSTASFGKEQPLEEGDDEASWARNRRAEFTIVGGEVTVVPEELR